MLCSFRTAAAEAGDVVVLGDFNSEEQDSPCWLLRRGRLERNHTDACCPQVGEDYQWGSNQRSAAAILQWSSITHWGPPRLQPVGCLPTHGVVVPANPPYA